MNLNQVVTAIVRTDITPVGRNPEMADITNPQGTVYGYRAYVLAVAPDGSQWVHKATCTGGREERAMAVPLRVAAKINSALLRGQRLNPEYWNEYRPQYGSEAYQRNGGDAEMIEWERRSMEDEQT